MKRILARILGIKEEEINGYNYSSAQYPHWNVWHNSETTNKQQIGLEEIFDYIDNKLIP